MNSEILLSALWGFVLPSFILLIMSYRMFYGAARMVFRQKEWTKQRRKRYWLALATDYLLQVIDMVARLGIERGVNKVTTAVEVDGPDWGDRGRVRVSDLGEIEALRPRMVIVSVPVLTADARIEYTGATVNGPSVVLTAPQNAYGVAEDATSTLTQVCFLDFNGWRLVLANVADHVLKVCFVRGNEYWEHY